MNRKHYFDYIESKLCLLEFRLRKRGKINLLELNIHSETFFADMLNILLGHQLRNLNTIKQNIPGIDLVDEKNKIIAQVSSVCTKRKIESSLAKEIFQKYEGYRFNFISICKDADKMRKQIFINPHNALFDPATDIIDITSILKTVQAMSIERQREFYEFIKKELGSEIDIVKLDSNLAVIINILAVTNLRSVVESPEVNSFEINKKTEINNLAFVAGIIDEYKIYYSKLNEKYAEFDQQGVNRSLSVLQVIKSEYTKLLADGKEAHELFWAIIENVIDIILKSKNYQAIPREELEMCVYILVVDAYIKCKIFVNPEGYNYVASR